MGPDVVVAEQLCAAVGVPHVVTPTLEDGDIVRTELTKNELTSFQALDHNWCWPVAQAIADSEAVTYDGLAGDILSAGLFQNDEHTRLYRAERFDELAHRLAPAVRLLMPGHAQGAAIAADPYPVLIEELRRK